MRPDYAEISFEDQIRAEANLRRLEKRLPPSLLGPLASLLAHSPDPDGALNLLDRYAEAAPPEVLVDLPHYPTALTYLVAIFGYSAFLAETFLAEPTLPILFARDRKFTKLKSSEELTQDYARFATTHPDHWLSSQLARFKRRHYLRIVLKDVLGLSTLGETTIELSSLADVILTNAVTFCDRELEKRYGQPQYRDVQGRIVRSGFSIVSLGKLGGNELNYSSDIDLLFLYERDGDTAGGNERDSVITNKEYFVRLAHAITRTITQTTPHGQVFRVDLRLRPEGEMGDLAISVKSALEYYEHRARDWELQMLIKARHSAGDLRVMREFIRGVENYVYSSPADFEAVESVLQSRETISKKLREGRDATIDVKRHRGGIRDIEFLVQCLQRLHGGRDPWVRSGGTLLALRKLNDKGWLSDRDYAALVHAYQFFRNVEHRIQFELGRQTHRLPAEAEALDRLARRCGIENREAPGGELLRRIRKSFISVDDIYQRVIHPRASAGQGSAYELKPLLISPGDPAPHSYASLLNYLDAQAPELSRLVREAPVSERNRKNVIRLFSALLASSENFRLARIEPHCVESALELAGASEYLANLLAHHPEDISILDRSPSTEGEPDDQLRMALEPPATLEPFPWAVEHGLAVREKMTLLRRQFRAHVLELGVADLRDMSSVFHSLKQWSALASRSVASALWIGQEALNGAPPECADPEPGASILVLGLGRLGLSEFDLASDADLLFVAPSETSRDEIAALARVAEKTIEALSSYTRDGMLFAVDTRLRPGGQEGELVVTEKSLLNYVKETAQCWEALTYLKACPIAGNLALAGRVFESLRDNVLERFQNYPDLEGELQQMRRRLERETGVPPSNLKTAPGGYYDVDFAVSYLRLQHRIKLCAGANTLEQIEALRKARLLRDEDALVLSEGAAFLRTLDHAVRLATGKSAEGIPEHSGHREAVENVTRRWGLLKDGESLASRLREVQQQVRYVYRRVVGSE